MTVREVLTWPDSRLSRRCVKVGDTDVSALVRDLFDTMYAAPGRGLAAPQIGVMVRVFVTDVGWKDGEGTPRACIDPEIVWHSDATRTMTEACLSIPGISAEIVRPAEIVLRFRGVDGVMREERLTGLEAVCAQHEMDHLDGIVTFDRVPETLRAELLAAYGNAA